MRGPIEPDTVVAFAGGRRIAAGSLAEAAIAAKRALAEDPSLRVLVFDGETGAVVDLDLRGEETEIRARYTPPAAPPPGRGRPKLGVVAREVTLLPGHWDWLARQPGGASVSLRRLVDAARKAGAARERAQTRRDAAYRFMAAMAGDLTGFEAASRALFGGDRDRLVALTLAWPPDLRDQLLALLDEDPADKDQADKDQADKRPGADGAGAGSR